MTGLDPVVVWVAQGLISVVLIAAALHKLRGLREFASVLRAYQIVPDAIAGGLAPWVPILELLVVIGLWVPASQGAAAAGAALLLTSYALAIGVNLVRGRRSIDCGCTWGSHGTGLSGWLLVRNGALLLPCAALLLERAPRSVSWVDGLVAVAGVAILALCYRAFEALIAHLPSLQRLQGTA